jgi:hypothetical protein
VVKKDSWHERDKKDERIMKNNGRQITRKERRRKKIEKDRKI